MTTVDSRVLEGIDASRRAGWAKAYSRQAGAILLIRSTALALAASNEPSALGIMRKALEWTVFLWQNKDRGALGQASGRRLYEIQEAAEIATQAIDAIEEFLGPNWGQSDDSTRMAPR